MTKKRLKQNDNDGYQVVFTMKRSVTIEVRDPEMLEELERLGYTAQSIFDRGVRQVVDSLLLHRKTINIDVARRYKEARWARSAFPELLKSVDEYALDVAENGRDPALEAA